MYNTALSLTLSSILSLSLLMTGCSSDEVEEQAENPQVKQEETIDKERIETMTNIMCDLTYYKSITDKMADVTRGIETKTDCVTAYATVETTLEEVKAYKNCDETTDLKGHLINTLISTMECIDCIYQGDSYGAERAANDVTLYSNKYQQECKKLTEEYCADNTKTY